MTGAPRPWWASPDASSTLDDLDPVDAFRAARRSDTDAAGADPGTDPDPDAAPGGPDPTPQPDEASAPSAPHRPELCGICPLCTLARSLEETRPELVEHLTEAARHLAAALRALVEPSDAGPTPGSGTSDRVQRIPLDRDDPDRTGTDHGDAP
jgi:hypothetical protein